MTVQAAGGLDGVVGAGTAMLIRDGSRATVDLTRGYGTRSATSRQAGLLRCPTREASPSVCFLPPQQKP
jgi:hypothetical protein